jgi:moderate conductance mechanosensitive channel
VPDLSFAPLAITLRIAGIALLALIAILALRSASRIGIRRVLERRRAEASAAGAAAPGVDLERRLTTVGEIVVRIGAALILTVGGLMILREFNVDIGPAIAGLGVVGIALGLGAQTVVKDWLAGVFVVLENQFSQGDLVRIGGVEGVVEEFSLRRTQLRDADGSVHHVPNGQITVASNLTSRVSEGTGQDSPDIDDADEDG